MGRHLRKLGPRQGDDLRAELEAGKDFGRYLDVDGDYGIAYRTLPGRPPRPRGLLHPAAPPRDPYARYSEEGSVYVGNMERLLLELETAKSLIPAPITPRPAKRRTPHGVIYFRLDHAGHATSRWSCWKTRACMSTACA